ncbi:O-antigen ligase family protein [Sabulilitoribacter multivorans]|uniref:O-antigen ligase family protein n=2 Tax=Flaviramulus multivorans TaxID=1304750 RepID=A0ABS9IFQ7_9FLAO|nr:O-antigen ligase family protein [Flaviramulus multivorans]MCF7559606.1 O-antigen ligase family protein [Flaviramulus multivorans]
MCKDLIKEKHIVLSVLIFALFPIIPNTIKGFPIILLFVVTLFSNIKKEINWKWLLINSSLFFAYLISLIYTENIKVALVKLETGLSILIIPIIFNGFLSQYSFDKKLKIKFFKIFIISSFCFSVLSLLFIVSDSTTSYHLNWYTDKFRSQIEDVPLIGQHPIYASIFLSLSVIFFLDLVNKKSILGKHNYLFVLFTLTNVFLLIILVSKGVIISLLLVCLVYTLKTMKNFRLTILIIFISIFFLTFNRRFNEALTVETHTRINENFSTSIRIGIYKCVFKLIKNEPIFGYGIGDSQHVLNLCYANESNILLKNRFNSHNQYLDIILKTGVFGFMFFIYFLYSNFKKAFKNQSEVLSYILFFYVIILLTENILVRQSGVILFFFLVIFLNHSSKILEVDKYDNSKPEPI